MEFDYIIVGGGSAGCVLANRLSADPRHKVCLIEAGSSDNKYPILSVPSFLLYGMKNKRINWRYWTVPQTYCNNRKMFCPRGRILGGSSSINAMCYVRGNPTDYDEWSKLGNTGWSYNEVLPYFQKMENLELNNNQYHECYGRGGLLNITDHRNIHPLNPIFISAAQEAGYITNDNFNSTTQEGIGYFHVTQKNGQRCSNAHAYLELAKERSNLTILLNTHVTKILFTGKCAKGIRYYKDKKYIDIHARKEIILAAGAIGSPQLLLLSGIGPYYELEKHGIEPLHILPGVGENLQDHLDIHNCVLEKTRYALTSRPSAFLNLIIDLFNYTINRSGPLTSNIAQAGGFIKSEEDLLIPDLQWHFLPLIFTCHGERLNLLRRYYAYTLSISLLCPKSRGRVTLEKNDPFVPPKIDPNYLAEQEDLDKMIIGFKKTREVLSQPAFKKHQLKEYEPEEYIQSDEQIAEYIRSNAESIYHPVGTCKMGVESMAVVDTQLKVHGIQRLRVIDASVMPIIVRGNTNAATTMIAEKGADYILNGN